MKNTSRLPIINNVPYRQNFDHSGETFSIQILVPNSFLNDLITTLHEHSMQGHPVSPKTFNFLRSKNYASDLTGKIQNNFHNCRMCIRSKPCSNMQLRLPLEQIYEPSDGAEGSMEIYLVGEEPASSF